MIRRLLFHAALISFSVVLADVCYGQSRGDSIQKLKEVVVRAYLSERPILTTPSSVSVVDHRQLRNQAGTSLVPAINTVPGLRMEERSPGSYRLSIRGSLLRSPFGIRNVKIYMDDFPLTDAGGNTYLNAIDAESINNIEILKGPDGSLFGANSGGVILLNTVSRADSSHIRAALTGGSYGLVHERIGVRKDIGNHSFNVDQAFQHSDGYRRNSALKRHYGQANYSWQYSDNNQLKVLAFFSDLDYQTPGGLTKAQYDLDARAARPSSPVAPGAAEQQAGIMNRTLFGGVMNELQIAKPLKHVVAVFGSHTDFENPFITNYEVRDEGTAGLRSYFEYTSPRYEAISWKANVGVEWQKTNTRINNYDNLMGEKGAEQSADKLNANQHFFFSRLAASLFDRIDIEAAASINYYRYRFEPISLTPSPSGQRKFTPQIMPRVALSWKLTENVAWRSSASRGYAPPTIAEIRASDQQINVALEPESGWNYESGVRLRNNNDRFWLDASVFYYRLNSAISRRVNTDDSEYFINAGGTRQIGFESQLSAWLVAPSGHGLIRGVQLRNSLTLSNFKFREYINGQDDFSGKRLTGVPSQVVVSSANVLLPRSLALFVQHNYTSAIPLNDGNSAFSESYNLIQAKLSWSSSGAVKPGFGISASLDNILDEKYSLGNDLNAFGGRYYNAAPARNFFIGINAYF